MAVAATLATTRARCICRSRIVVESGRSRIVFCLYLARLSMPRSAVDNVGGFEGVVGLINGAMGVPAGSAGGGDLLLSAGRAGEDDGSGRVPEIIGGLGADVTAMNGDW